MTYTSGGRSCYAAPRTSCTTRQEAVGVVALVNGQPICVDIFDRAATLHAYWSNLVRSYALEAESVTSAATSPSTAQASTMTLLTSAVAAPKRVFRSRGLGSDVRVATSDVLVAGLVLEEAAVHIALFPRDRHRTAADSLARPSARARRLRQGSHR
jgi:hypothetical protein